MKARGMTRKEAAAQTRRNILDAAKELYSNPKNSDAPISRLARLAGVAEGTVFVHFPDKPSLLAATFQDEIEQALAEAWAGLPTDGRCLDKLMGLVRPLYAFYAKRPAFYRILLKESLFLGGEWGHKVLDFTLHFVGQVAELMELAKSEGEYKQSVDASLAARGFFGLYFIELLHGLNEETFDLEATSRRFEMVMTQFESGLLSQKELKQ